MLFIKKIRLLFDNFSNIWTILFQCIFTKFITCTSVTNLGQFRASKCRGPSAQNLEMQNERGGHQLRKGYN